MIDINLENQKQKYSYNIENKEIYKGISSIKYMNETIAEELFEISKNNYENFVDLLVDIVEKTMVEQIV